MTKNGEEVPDVAEGAESGGEDAQQEEGNDAAAHDTGVNEQDVDPGSSGEPSTAPRRSRRKLRPSTRLDCYKTDTGTRTVELVLDDDVIDHDAGECMNTYPFLSTVYFFLLVCSPSSFGKY